MKRWLLAKKLGSLLEFWRSGHLIKSGLIFVWIQYSKYYIKFYKFQFNVRTMWNRYQPFANQIVVVWIRIIWRLNCFCGQIKSIFTLFAWQWWKMYECSESIPFTKIIWSEFNQHFVASTRNYFLLPVAFIIMGSISLVNQLWSIILTS